MWQELGIIHNPEFTQQLLSFIILHYCLLLQQYLYCNPAFIQLYVIIIRLYYLFL